MKEYGIKKRGLEKVKLKSVPATEHEVLKKPDWLRVKCMDNQDVLKLKQQLRENKLHTVCEEAFCPNIGECFSNGTATFMILGDICTRRCAFCDVAHGRPNMPDPEEPERLADTVSSMNLSYVVITSVDRDDLEDGGSRHFVKCIRKTREINQDIRIEILTPDFKKCMHEAVEIISQSPPDVFNHNMETVPRLYRTIRPGSDYVHSLKLIQEFKKANPGVPAKSGVMLGLGESYEEVCAVMNDLREYGCDMLTVGQYLAPSKHHHPVMRYVPPDEFSQLEAEAIKMGFSEVAAGPLVRSSYHADLQAARVIN